MPTDHRIHEAMVDRLELEWLWEQPITNQSTSTPQTCKYYMHDLSWVKPNTLPGCIFIIMFFKIFFFSKSDVQICFFESVGVDVWYKVVHTMNTFWNSYIFDIEIEWGVFWDRFRSTFKTLSPKKTIMNKYSIQFIFFFVIYSMRKHHFWCQNHYVLCSIELDK